MKGSINAESERVLRVVAHTVLNTENKKQVVIYTKIN